MFEGQESRDTIVCVREIRILFLYVKYLEFSDLSQVTLRGYFGCHSEPPLKNLRSKHSCLWYKMMSAFHFGTGAWFMWGTLSKARKQTLKDLLTFLFFSSFPALVLSTAPWGKLTFAASLWTSGSTQLHSETLLRWKHRNCFPDWILQTHSLVWICAGEQINRRN